MKPLRALWIAGVVCAWVVGCSSGGSGGGGGAAAPLADFCKKCEQCVQDPTFSEGFCTPFQSGTTFDTAGCTANGDTAQLDMPTASSATLTSWTCQQFDDNE